MPVRSTKVRWSSFTAAICAESRRGGTVQSAHLPDWAVRCTWRCRDQASSGPLAVP